LIEALLRPGDCLYLPRGYLHAATALGGVSTHLTLGVHVWTRYALAEQLMDQALQSLANNPAVRGSLALGIDIADPTELRQDVELVTAALADAVKHADIDQMSEALLRSARSNQRAEPVGPLKQLRDADVIAADTQIVLRRHLIASLDHTGADIVLRSRAGDLTVAESDVAPLKTLLTAGVARAGDLSLDLARRLLLAGVVIVE
jgi:bifunctional lysine-specific demethylase and histidyl-hydroxylase NO66